MSTVPKSKRKESGYLVVDLAYEIYHDILDICLRLPNRFTYLVMQKMVDYAEEIASNAKQANSIFPKIQSDAIERRAHYEKAYTALEALNSMMEFFLYDVGTLDHKIGNVTVHVTESELKSIALKLDKEKILLSGSVKSDIDRFASLPPYFDPKPDQPI